MCAARFDADFGRGSIRGMSKVVYSVHVEPMQNGGFYISVPALLDCRSTAKTFDSALKKAKTLIEKHLKVLAHRRKPIPVERQDVPPVCLPIKVNLPKGAATVPASGVAA